jgi:sec-independent protein translocase protein TatB
MGAGELLIIAVIGLLVLGPERLPVAIRTVSKWVKSAKQMANAVSAEMTHELKVHELHQNLKKAEEQGLKNLSPEISESVQELKDAAASVTRQYEDKPQTPQEPQSPFSKKDL